MSDDPNEVEPLTPAHLSIGHVRDVLPSFLLDQAHNVTTAVPQSNRITFRTICCISGTDGPKIT